MEGENSLTDRINALQELGELNSLRANARIKNFQNELNESYASGTITAGVKRKLDGEIKRVSRRLESHKDSVELAGNLFRGFSYGSVLILMALGLAITFGLMGVINMAHGELMMIGAYVTYEVQMFFGHTPDTPIDSYYFAALPLAFLVSALVGLVMEGRGCPASLQSAS